MLTVVSVCLLEWKKLELSLVMQVSGGTESWLRRLFKVHQGGMRLSRTGSQVLDDLQFSLPGLKKWSGS